MTDPTETVAAVVRVRGEVSRRFAPDRAMLSVSVERTSATARAAALDEAAATATALRAALDGLPGVRRVVLSQVSVHDATEWNPAKQTQERAGWIAYLGGQVEVAADAAGPVAAVIAGTEATVAGVAWDLDDRTAARRETRVAAVNAAREAAEDFAGAVGRQLGALRELADSGLSRSEPFAFDARLASAAASAPHVELDPAPVEMHVAVEATYLLI
jgi:uncharacterized protein YggE